MWFSAVFICRMRLWRQVKHFTSWCWLNNIYLFLFFLIVPYTSLQTDLWLWHWIEPSDPHSNKFKVLTFVFLFFQQLPQSINQIIGFKFLYKLWKYFKTILHFLNCFPLMWQEEEIPLILTNMLLKNQDWIAVFGESSCFFELLFSHFWHKSIDRGLRMCDRGKKGLVWIEGRLKAHLHYRQLFEIQPWNVLPTVLCDWTVFASPALCVGSDVKLWKWCLATNQKRKLYL